MRALLAIAFSAVTLAASPAAAIDFTQKLVGATGRQLTQGGEDCKLADVPGKDCSIVDLTLEDAAIIALETPIEADRGEDPRRKFERDNVARKIHAAPARIELSPEDTAMVKDRIGKVWNAPQVGAAWRLLDPTLK